ncbi:MAG: hypothetical protein GY751_20105 [Bacteroidetes bacterium]|nr:hypothetical protein [Bacteroidota bacterium]
MEANQVQIILGVLLVITIASFFFKVTRKLAVFGIIAVLCLTIGFLAGVGVTKETIKTNNPVCYKVIYEAGK